MWSYCSAEKEDTVALCLKGYEDFDLPFVHISILWFYFINTFKSLTIYNIHQTALRQVVIMTHYNDYRRACDMEGVTKQASLDLTRQNTHPKVYVEVYTVNIILFFFSVSNHTHILARQWERLLHHTALPVKLVPNGEISLFHMPPSARVNGQGQLKHATLGLQRELFLSCSEAIQ